MWSKDAEFKDPEIYQVQQQAAQAAPATLWDPQAAGSTNITGGGFTWTTTDGQTCTSFGPSDDFFTPGTTKTEP